jgi:hypothetical protein
MTNLRAFGWLDGLKSTAETKKRAQVFAELIRARLLPESGGQCTRSGKPMPPSGAANQVRRADALPLAS